MTREATKKKRDKKRAEKKKHEHQTEQRAEAAAKKRRFEKEEIIAIVVILLFIPFAITGVIFWPPNTGPGSSSGGTGLSDGNYYATFLGSRPASGNDVAVVVLDVNGESVFVNDHDLSGKAAKNSSAFFEGRRGEPINIVVTNGSITDWKPAASD